MKRFFAFVQKEFRHILRDRRTLLLLFGMPVAQVLLFGFVLTNEIKNAPIALLDAAHDEASTQLSSKLLSSGYFRLEKTLAHVGELEAAFRDGKVKMAVVFPENFAQNLAREGKTSLQFIGDASDPNTATTLINYAQAIVMDWQSARNVRPSKGDGLDANAASGLGGGAGMMIEVQTRMLYNPELRAVFGFVPGVMTLILMLISAMMTSITIAREKEMGTMEILLASPLKPIHIILGKATPYLILSFINAAVVVLLGIFVFGMPMNGSIGLLAAESALYMFVALCLGIFISTRAASQQQAMFISALGLMMPTMLLSGFIFPRESMPWILQKMGNVIPATWFNQIIKGIMIKGVGMEFLWVQTCVLGFMALFFIGLSVKNFKNRLE